MLYYAETVLTRVMAATESTKTDHKTDSSPVAAREDVIRLDLERIASCSMDLRNFQVTEDFPKLVSAACSSTFSHLRNFIAGSVKEVDLEVISDLRKSLGSIADLFQIAHATPGLQISAPLKQIESKSEQLGLALHLIEDLGPESLDFKDWYAVKRLATELKQACLEHGNKHPFQ